MACRDLLCEDAIRPFDHPSCTERNRCERTGPIPKSFDRNTKLTIIRSGTEGKGMILDPFLSRQEAPVEELATLGLQSIKAAS